jgi:hypothetical protein
MAPCLATAFSLQHQHMVGRDRHMAKGRDCLLCAVFVPYEGLGRWWLKSKCQPESSCQWMAMVTAHGVSAETSPRPHILEMVRRPCRMISLAVDLHRALESLKRRVIGRWPLLSPGWVPWDTGTQFRPWLCFVSRLSESQVRAPVRMATRLAVGVSEGMHASPN